MEQGTMKLEVINNEGSKNLRKMQRQQLQLLG